jgi:protein-tyrosine-phosphatase
MRLNKHHKLSPKPLKALYFLLNRKMNILFICAHNRFRSKIAENIFNYYNLNPKHKCKSVGVSLDLLNPFMASSVLTSLKEIGISPKDIESKLLDEFALNWANKIILVANNVNPNIFPKEKTEIWPISNCSEEDYPKIIEIRDEIEKNVKKLISEI